MGVDNRQLLRAEEAAHLLGIGRTMIYDMIRRGEVPVLRIGRLVRVPRHALEEWITDRTEGRQAG